LVPLDLHFLNGYVKINVGLGKGKKHHDKRASIKEKEWKKEEQRIMKQKSLNK
ncbi:MAG: SsrA-binding protein, partial [Burkholderiaceae bacterium]